MEIEAKSLVACGNLKIMHQKSCLNAEGTVDLCAQNGNKLTGMIVYWNYSGSGRGKKVLVVEFYQ